MGGETGAFVGDGVTGSTGAGVFSTCCGLRPATSKVQTPALVSWKFLIIRPVVLISPRMYESVFGYIPLLLATASPLPGPSSVPSVQKSSICPLLSDFSNS